MYSYIHTIAARGNRVIAEDILLAGDDPEAGWRLISVEKIHGGNGLDGKVTLEPVVFLRPVLDEEGVPTDAVDKIMFEGQVVDAVDGNTTIPRVVDTTVTLERLT